MLPYLFMSRDSDDDDVRDVGKHDLSSVLLHTTLSFAAVVFSEVYFSAFSPTQRVSRVAAKKRQKTIERRGCPFAAIAFSHVLR